MITDRERLITKATLHIVARLLIDGELFEYLGTDFDETIPAKDAELFLKAQRDLGLLLFQQSGAVTFNNIDGGFLELIKHIEEQL